MCATNLKGNKMLQCMFFSCCKVKEAHDFAKTPLELHVGLTLVVDAGFAVLTSQRKLVVY